MSLTTVVRKRQKHDPIRLVSRRHNYFPQRFIWRGQRYDVHAIVRAWTEMQRGRRSARHYFRVRCREGIFDIYQDIAVNAWYLTRQVK